MAGVNIRQIPRGERTASPAATSITRRVLARLVALGAVTALVVVACAPTSGATTFATPAAQSKVAQTQQQITQLLTTIGAEQERSAELGARYDAAEAHMLNVRAALHTTAARISQTVHQIANDKVVLARDAVSDYVFGIQGSQVESLFVTSANTAIIEQQYSDTAVGDLDAAKQALGGAQATLVSTQARQQTEERRAQSITRHLATLQQENQQAAQESEATLTSLKGSLGSEVAAAAQAKAQREAAAAAAAAAASEAAAARQAAAAAAAASQAAAAAAAASQAAAAATSPAATPPGGSGGTAAPSGAPPSTSSGVAPDATLTAAQVSAQAAAQAANQAAASAGGPSVGFAATSSTTGLVAVHAAESQLGVPYVWGGESPGVAFDCSGLTQWSWAQAGITIPRTSEVQYADVARVPLSDLEPGDLLFYYNLDGTSTVDHVVMYVGSGPYGQDTIVQAPFTGATVSYDSLYTFGLVGAGRP